MLLSIRGESQNDESAKATRQEAAPNLSFGQKKTRAEVWPAVKSDPICITTLLYLRIG